MVGTLNVNTPRKVVFIGNAHTGKSKVVRKLLEEAIPNRPYVATLGVEVFPFREQGKTYNIWDCGGDKRYRGLCEGYYEQAHIVIIFEGGGHGQGDLTKTEWCSLVNRTTDASIYVVRNPSIDDIKGILATI